MAYVTGLEGIQSGAAAPQGAASGAMSRMPNWRDLANSRQDPLMAFDWNVSVRGPDSLELGASHVEEIHVPLPTYDSDSVTYQGRKYYFAKFEDIGAASAKFYIDNRLSALQIVRQWQQKIKSSKGNYRPPAAYKGTIIVTPCDTTQTPVAELVLSGVFPTRLPNLDFTSQGDRVTMDVEFSVDQVRIVFASQPRW